MHVYLRGDTAQRLRLASGLVLFAFAASHFLNHALGLVGLEVMHQAQALRTAVTRSCRAPSFSSRLSSSISPPPLQACAAQHLAHAPLGGVQIVFGLASRFCCSSYRQYAHSHAFSA